MKYLLFLGLCVWLSTASAQTTVIVAPLETARYSLDRQAENARALIEDAVVNSGGARVVERQRMDSMVQELNFQNYSNLSDPSKAVQMGKMLGAHYFIQGTLMSVNEDVRQFQGYGVATRTKITNASVRIRAIDIGSGSVSFSRVYEGSYTSNMTNSGGQTNSDSTGQAVISALNQLAADSDFSAVFKKASGKTTERAQVSISVSCTLNPCDLEVDGIFYGSTPTDLELTDGKVVSISLTKAGHLPWEKKMMPREGMSINAELETQ